MCAKAKAVPFGDRETSDEDIGFDCLPLQLKDLPLIDDIAPKWTTN